MSRLTFSYRSYTHSMIMFVELVNLLLPCYDYNMENRIIVRTRLVFDDNRHLYYTEDPSILAEPFADLMCVPSKWVRQHFKSFNDITFEFAYNEKTHIEELYGCILDKIGFKKDPRIPRDGWDGANPLRIIEDDMLIGIDDYKHSLEDVLTRYHIKDTLHTVMVFICTAGDIWNDDGLRYYMPSRENCRHKSPHVHVEYKHEEKATVEIKSGNKLAGNMKAKRMKVVKEKILNNQEFLLRCWNDKTDGLSVDINYYLGITPIIENPSF